MPSGKPLSDRTRNEIVRLAKLRDVDGRRVWSERAIATRLGLDRRTVSRVLAGCRLDTPSGSHRSPQTDR